MTPSPCAGPWTHGDPVQPSHPTLTAWLDAVTTTRGTAPALTFWDNVLGRPTTSSGLGYHALADRAAQLAGALHRRGVQPGDRVAWLGWAHPDVVCLLLAVARLGAALVPLNHRLAQAEWQQVLADCTPRVLVHDNHWAAQASGLSALTNVPAGPLPAGHRSVADTAPPPDVAAPGAAVLLVYTSGTTGRPKGAVHTQANLLANMAIAAQEQSVVPEDRVLTVLPLFHVGGLCIQTLPALYRGAHVHLLARFDPTDTLALFERVRPTLTLQVPATMKALSDHPAWAQTPLSSLRAVWAGSSPLPPDQVALFEARGVPVCNVYGATETGPFSIARRPDMATGAGVGRGWPAPGVSVCLGPAPGATSAPRTGEVGELWLKGPNVVARYWPDTPACDAQGYFHSGDLARQTDDGGWVVVGRAKDMVISGGENIYPAEVEQALLALPGLAEVAVIGVPDPQWGESLVAVVVPREPGTGAPTADRLRAGLQNRLARYKQPRRYVFVEAMPKTALGKVQKHLLMAVVASSTGVDAAGQPDQQQHG